MYSYLCGSPHIHIAIDNGDNIKTATPQQAWHDRHQCRDEEGCRSPYACFADGGHPLAGHTAVALEILESKLSCHLEKFQLHLVNISIYIWGLSNNWLHIGWKRWLKHPESGWVHCSREFVCIPCRNKHTWGGWVAYPNERRLSELFGTWYAVGRT